MSFAPHKRRRGLLFVAILTPLFLAVVALTSVSNAPLDAESRQPNLSAALVNLDQIVETGEGRDKTPVAAGRLLVGQLVTSNETGFDWTLTDSASAARGLESGRFAAVVTIPSNFSQAYISSSTSTPEQAVLNVATDGSHSYLAATLASALAQTLDSQLSQELSQNFIKSLLIGYTTLGTDISEAGEAQSALASGLSEIDKLTRELPGLTKALSDGATLVDEGSDELTNGLTELTRLTEQTLVKVATIESLYDELKKLIADGAAPAEIDAKLARIASETDALAIDVLATDIGVDIAAEVSTEVTIGATAVAEGSRELAEGTPALSAGIAGVATGASEIAQILTEAGKAIPRYTDESAQATAQVAAQPIITKVATQPPVPSPTGAMGALAIPIALWLGALVLSLVYNPFEARALLSRASTLRITVGAVLPLTVFALAQGVIVVVGAHAAGVSPVHHLGLYVLTAITAISFMFIHQGLSAIAGKYSWLVSIALLSLQVAGAGILLPANATPGVIRALGDVMPLSVAIRGTQEMITGGELAHGIGAAVVIGLGGLVGLFLLASAITRGRRIGATSREVAVSAS